MTKNNNIQLIKTLIKGGIAVLLTDTIYGICTNALNIDSVKKLYQVRKRDPKKAVIILINDLNSLVDFGINITEKEKNILNILCPSPLTFLIEENSGKFDYLKGESNYLSFRIPNNKNLLKILKETGPIIAPSANLEGKPPANNITEAKNYFGNNIDYYSNSGECKNTKPSTVAIFEQNKFQILRQGAFEIPTEYINND